jgi:hypothetical protein
VSLQRIAAALDEALEREQASATALAAAQIEADTLRRQVDALVSRFSAHHLLVRPAALAVSCIMRPSVPPLFTQVRLSSSGPGGSAAGARAAELVRATTERLIAAEVSLTHARAEVARLSAQQQQQRKRAAQSPGPGPGAAAGDSSATAAAIAAAASREQSRLRSIAETAQAAAQAAGSRVQVLQAEADSLRAELAAMKAGAQPIHSKSGTASDTDAGSDVARLAAEVSGITFELII